MNPTIKSIIEYGVLVVIAAAFITISWRRFVWSMQKYDKLSDVHDICIKEFSKIAADFNTTVSNHMEHETQALRELTRAVERMCILVEMPNKDYMK